MTAPATPLNGTTDAIGGVTGEETGILAEGAGTDTETGLGAAGASGWPSGASVTGDSVTAGADTGAGAGAGVERMGATGAGLDGMGATGAGAGVEAGTSG